MILRLLLGLLPAWLWAAILAGALACGGIVTWRTATGVERAKWQAIELRRQQADADTRREDARMSWAASAEFEALRAQQARRAPQIAKEVRDALQAPIACPAGTLADVLVPAAAVDGLRRAGADAAAPGPAASGPGR